jgi:hypothetical protein
LVYLLVFHAYINEMQVQEAKYPVKNLVRQRCAGDLIPNVLYSVQCNTLLLYIHTLTYLYMVFIKVERMRFIIYMFF